MIGHPAVNSKPLPRPRASLRRPRGSPGSSARSRRVEVLVRSTIYRVTAAPSTSSASRSAAALTGGASIRSVLASEQRAQHFGTGTSSRSKVRSLLRRCVGIRTVGHELETGERKVERETQPRHRIQLVLLDVARQPHRPVPILRGRVSAAAETGDGDVLLAVATRRCPQAHRTVRILPSTKVEEQVPLAGLADEVGAQQVDVRRPAVAPTTPEVDHLGERHAPGRIFEEASGDRGDRGSPRSRDRHDQVLELPSHLLVGTARGNPPERCGIGRNQVNRLVLVGDHHQRAALRRRWWRRRFGHGDTARNSGPACRPSASGIFVSARPWYSSWYISGTASSNRCCSPLRPASNSDNSAW